MFRVLKEKKAQTLKTFHKFRIRTLIMSLFFNISNPQLCDLTENDESFNDLMQDLMWDTK